MAAAKVPFFSPDILCSPTSQLPQADVANPCPYPLRGMLADPHANSSKASLELSVCAVRHHMVCHLAWASMSSVGFDCGISMLEFLVTIRLQAKRHPTSCGSWCGKSQLPVAAQCFRRRHGPIITETVVPRPTEIATIKIATVPSEPQRAARRILLKIFIILFMAYPGWSFRAATEGCF
jgi:hypothetical protein